jgi:voltage-gated potassium channel
MKKIKYSTIKSLIKNQLIDDQGKIKLFDVFIISLILLSSAAILIEVSLENNNHASSIFDFIEVFTTIVFSIEYMLRVWLANEDQRGISGIKKRLSYIFSFYGLIDLFSILPFYSGLFTGKQTLSFLKIIRIIRLLRLARYLKSFDFILNATKNKKSELFISMQIVLLFTFVLSVLLFFVEHKVQPENFSSITDALIWSFSKYIGDIAGYGDFTPITLAGKMLATAVGILSIAIFAVPAGIIASGFVEEIEAEKKLKEVSYSQNLIERSFQPSLNPILGISIPPRKRSIPQIQARLTLTEPEIFEAVRNSEQLRIIWDKSDPSSQNFDQIVVENKRKNTSYGCADLENSSPIRIVNSLGKGERAISHFCQTLSQLGGYQLVSNEVFSGGDFESQTKHRLDLNDAFADAEQFKTLPDEIKLFCDHCTSDLNEKSWVILIRSSASHRDLHFHITFGGEQGDTKTQDVKNPTINQVSVLDYFIREMTDQMKDLGFIVGTHEDFKSTNPQLLHNYIHQQSSANVITIFISINLLCGPDRIYYQVLKHLNQCIDKAFGA